MSEVVWTIAEVVKSSVEFLTKKGISHSRLDVELMLAKCLGKKRIDLYLEYDRPLTVAERSDFKAFLFRRGNHEPAAYILEEAGFMGLMYKVSRDTLIPRPDTELLVEETLKLLPGSKACRILDVGAGTGCVGISLLKLRSDLRVETWDISDRAMAIAKWNGESLGVGDRYTLKLKSALEESSYVDKAEESFEGKFDGIVSNPPYITPKEYQNLDATVKDYEPKLALIAEQDGLEFYNALARHAPKIISPQGFMALEVGWTQAQDVARILKENGFKDIKIFKDLGSRERVVAAQLA